MAASRFAARGKSHDRVARAAAFSNEQKPAATLGGGLLPVNRRYALLLMDDIPPRKKKPGYPSGITGL
jgi:hypothetical protein